MFQKIVPQKMMITVIKKKKTKREIAIQTNISQIGPSAISLGHIILLGGMGRK